MFILLRRFIKIKKFINPSNYAQHINSLFLDKKFNKLGMLLSSKIDFKLGQTYFKILDHCLAYENGLVFSSIKRHRKYALTHITHNGKKFELEWDDQGPESLGMPNSRLVMSLFPCQNMIHQWDLDTHEQIKIRFDFAIPQNFCSNLMIFPDNSKICIQQNGPLGNNTFKLTYFNLPFKENSQPIEQWTSQNNQWNNDYTIICKGNNHTMVCWMKSRFDDYFDFYTFDIVNKLRHHKVPNTVGIKYGQNHVQINTAAMWEMRTNQFCFVTHSSRTKPEQDIINNNYIVNVMDNTIRQASFLFQNNDQHEMHIHQMNFGQTAMIRTIAFHEGAAIPSPIYYINNSNEEIIDKELWQCNHRSKYHLPGYDGNLLIEGIYQNGDVDHIRLWPKKIMQEKQMTVYLLTELYEKFEHDLLYEITTMLDYDQ